MRKYLYLLISLLLLVALLCGCTAAVEKEQTDSSMVTIQPTPTPTPISCPVRISHAFYAYIYDSANGKTGMDSMSLQLDNNWENSIVATTYVGIEAFDKYGNQLVADGTKEKAIKIKHDEAIDFGAYSSKFEYKISDFPGVDTFRVWIDKVVTADGREWTALDDKDYLIVKWNGRATGQLIKGLTNSFVDNTQQKLLENLKSEGLTYPQVPPLLFNGAFKSLGDSTIFMLQYDDFEIELYGDTKIDNPDKYYYIEFYLKADTDKDRIIKIMDALLPVICNISKDQATDIAEKGLNKEDITIDGYAITMIVPVEIKLDYPLIAPNHGIMLSITPTN